MKMDGYFFKSSKFEIEPGEDEEINPRMYGRQLAVWLKAQLENRDYSVEGIINEDWGRCLMCGRDPFMLWVGCGNVIDYDTAKEGDPPPAKGSIVWHCFATAEVFFWKRLFRKVETESAVSKLYTDLGNILREDSEITLVEQP